jgi:hypothetical protein
MAHATSEDIRTRQADLSISVDREPVKTESAPVLEIRDLAAREGTVK